MRDCVCMMSRSGLSQPPALSPGCGLCASTLQRQGVLGLEKAQERPWRLCQPRPCDRAGRSQPGRHPSLTVVMGLLAPARSPRVPTLGRKVCSARGGTVKCVVLRNTRKPGIKHPPSRLQMLPLSSSPPSPPAPKQAPQGLSVPMLPSPCLSPTQKMSHCLTCPNPAQCWEKSATLPPPPH